MNKTSEDNLNDQLHSILIFTNEQHICYEEIRELYRNFRVQVKVVRSRESYVSSFIQGGEQLFKKSQAFYVRSAVLLLLLICLQDEFYICSKTTKSMREWNLNTVWKDDSVTIIDFLEKDNNLSLLFIFTRSFGWSNSCNAWLSKAFYEVIFISLIKDIKFLNIKQTGRTSNRTNKINKYMYVKQPIGSFLWTTGTLSYMKRLIVSNFSLARIFTLSAKIYLRNYRWLVHNPLNVLIWARNKFSTCSNCDRYHTIVIPTERIRYY